MKQFYSYLIVCVVFLTIVKASSLNPAIIQEAPTKVQIPGPIRDLKHTITKVKVTLNWKAPATNKTFFIDGYVISQSVRSDKMKWTPASLQKFPNKTITYNLAMEKNATGFDIYITPFQMKFGTEQYWPWTRVYGGASSLAASTILTSIFAIVMIKIGISY